MIKGCKLTEEHRKKISLAVSNPSEETRRKMSEAKKGRKQSEETIRKRSIANSNPSEETRRKMSLSSTGVNNGMFGKHHSKEARRKQSEIKKGKSTWNKGLTMKNDERVKKYTEARKGFRHSEITKEKLRKYTGGKAANWQGGKSFEPYSVDWTETLRRSIRERDKYVCQICSGYGYCVHHIDYNKKNCNPNNLITLCKRCHNKTNFNRKKWINYFVNLIRGIDYSDGK